MDDETRRNWDLVKTPPGTPWSGRTRYAAATYFYHHGEMSAEVLEVYRICSRLDAENPLDVLRRWEIGAEWLERMASSGLISPLVGEMSARPTEGGKVSSNNEESLPPSVPPGHLPHKGGD